MEGRSLLRIPRRILLIIPGVCAIVIGLLPLLFQRVLSGRFTDFAQGLTTGFVLGLAVIAAAALYRGKVPLRR